MPINARYAHTNIVARDWRRLSRFYADVFGCAFIPPERHAHGSWVEESTNVPGAEVRGAHLRLPGHGDGGPTLEIFQYNHAGEPLPPAVNRPGLAHLAFQVDDVGAAREAVLRAGGRDFGKMVTVEVRGAGTITFVYVTDPEGNVIELQKWT